MFRSSPPRSTAVIVEIRAAMGGEDAGRFASELLRAYLRYAERQGWRAEVCEHSFGAPGVTRSAALRIEGTGLDALRAEVGTHRVTRQPVNDRTGRRHTSAVTVAVLPVPVDVTAALDLREVAITTFRSSGAGGQNVQKTETAIRAIHRPTGLSAVIQDERSQSRNKQRALQVLAARVASLRSGEAGGVQAARRSAMHGSGNIAERQRSYLWREGVAVDHRTGVRVDLGQALDGNLAPFAT